VCKVGQSSNNRKCAVTASKIERALVGEGEEAGEAASWVLPISRVLAEMAGINGSAVNVL